MSPFSSHFIPFISSQKSWPIAPRSLSVQTIPVHTQSPITHTISSHTLNFQLEYVAYMHKCVKLGSAFLSSLLLFPLFPPLSISSRDPSGHHQTHSLSHFSHISFCCTGIMCVHFVITTLLKCPINFALHLHMYCSLFAAYSFAQAQAQAHARTPRSSVAITRDETPLSAPRLSYWSVPPAVFLDGDWIDFSFPSPGFDSIKASIYTSTDRKLDSPYFNFSSWKTGLP